MIWWKISIAWPRVLWAIRKARKMAKRLEHDPEYYTEEYRYVWLQKQSKFVLWLYSVKLQVTGLEHWPKHHKGCVIIANHQSNFDPIFFLKLNDFTELAPVGYIGKQELAKKKIAKHLVKLIDVLLLDRSNPRQALKVMDEAKELLKVPRSMVIFPEGTRSHGPKLGPFHPGALRLPIKAYVPIVPVAIINSYEITQKGHKQKKKTIRIHFFPALHPKQTINMSTQFLADKLHKMIEDEITSDQKKNH